MALVKSPAYEAGDLTKAIRSYEDLVAHAGVSASLCYNLANSYARTGQTPSVPSWIRMPPVV